MTEQEIKEYILKRIRYADGDNLERAQAAFRNLSPEKMQEEYGQSGCTRQEILDEYIAAREKHKKALAWLQNLFKEQEE